MSQVAPSFPQPPGEWVPVYSADAPITDKTPRSFLMERDAMEIRLGDYVDPDHPAPVKVNVVVPGETYKNIIRKRLVGRLYVEKHSLTKELRFRFAVPD